MSDPEPSHATAAIGARTRAASLRLCIAACASALLGACGGDGASTESRVRLAAEYLDTLVPQWMARTGVPGVAVSVVYDGQTIYARGFGVRRVDRPEAVDADTVFQLASMSKSVGATVMAGNMPGAETSCGSGIGWNTPIRMLLPDFALAYPNEADNAGLSLGELYAHRSGLPDHAGDQLEDLGYDRTAVLERLRHVPLKPRGTYAYTNFGLTAAAQAMAQACETDWAALSDRTLYQPLGMTRTSSRFADFSARDNRAWGHVQVGLSYDSYGASPARYAVQDPPRQPDAQSPAGGVSSSVADLAKWMTLVLAQGKWQGRQHLSTHALQAAMTAQPGSNYGYGFNAGPDPHGHASVSHSGAFLMGAHTAFILWPEEKLGITVLTNAQPRGLAEAIALTFGERALGETSSTDWLAAMQANMHSLYTPLGRLAGQTPPDSPAPPQPLENYTGRYANAYYGEATVQRNEGTGELELILGPAHVRHPLRHWSGDLFVFEPLGENGPPGSVSAVEFGAGEMQVEYYGEDLAKGRFARVELDG